MIITSVLGDGLTRTCPIAIGSDWTVMGHLRNPSTPAPASDVTLWVFGDPSFATSYIWLGLDSLGNLDLETFDGVTTLDLLLPFSSATDHVCSARYNSTTHTLILRLDGVETSVVVDLGVFVFGSQVEELLRDDTTGLPGASAGYWFEYQSELSGIQIDAQGLAIAPIITVDLLSNTPLQTSIDVYPHNNTLTEWTVLGTVTTDFNDPLLATIAGPPTNTTPGTAFPITLDSAIFQDVIVGGVAAPQVWFGPLICPSGVFAMGAEVFATLTHPYRPVVFAFETLANALINSATAIADQDQPIQFGTTPGLAYYFKVTPGVNASPAVMELSVLAGLHLPVPKDVSIGINDSNPTRPAVFINTTDGDPIHFVQPFPAGESCRILVTGELIVADDFKIIRATVGPVIYDKTLAVFATPVMPSVDYDLYGTDQTTGWWACNPGGGLTHALAIFITKTGVVVGVPLDMGATSSGLKALTPNLANTKLYFVRNTGNLNQPVQQVTIPGGVVSTFVAGDANFFNSPGIFTLRDDTILSGYNSNIGTSHEVRRFDATGALLNTYAIGIGNHIEQLFPMPDDPLSFGVWYQPSNEFSHWRRVRVSDGATLFDVSGVKFTDAKYQGAVANTPDARFGTDFSCMPWVPRFDLFTPAPPPPSSCDCVNVVNIGGPVPNGINLTNAIALGGFFEIGDIDMLFGEQRFVIPHQAVAVSGASQGFTITDEAMGLMIVTTNGDPIRWLVSGETPTGSDGNLARDGTVFVIANITNAKNFRFILDGASATAQVVANFSRP